MTTDGGLHQLKVTVPRRQLVVGIDASLTAYGLAAKVVDGNEYFCWEHKSKLKGVQRLIDIEQFLNGVFLGLKVRFDIVHICMEQYAFSRGQAHVHAIGEGGGITKRALITNIGYVNKVAYPTMVAGTALKKFTTGAGNAGKGQMQLTVFKKWDADTTSDNEADAYALARVAQAIITGSTDFGYEREVVSKLEPHTEWTEPPPPPKSTTVSPPPQRRRRGALVARRPALK